MSWHYSLALVEEGGTDLRDPHISVTADGRLMLVMGLAPILVQEVFLPGLDT